MNEIFGMPMATLVVVLVGFLALCLLSVAWVAWRRPSAPWTRDQRVREPTAAARERCAGVAMSRSLAQCLGAHLEHAGEAGEDGSADAGTESGLQLADVLGGDAAESAQLSLGKAALIAGGAEGRGVDFDRCARRHGGGVRHGADCS